MTLILARFGIAAMLVGDRHAARCGGGGGGGDGGSRPPTAGDRCRIRRLRASCALAVRRRVRRHPGERHALPQCRSRAVRRRQSGERRESRRCLAAGSLVERRRAGELLTGVSFDGGRTWSQRDGGVLALHRRHAANGGDYERASDPWVTIGAGRHRLSDRDRVLGTEVRRRLVERGPREPLRRWRPQLERPVTLIRDGARILQRQGIDHRRSDRRAATSTRCGTGSRRPATGPAYLSRTTDGGATWEVPRAIYDPRAGNQTINNQMVVLPDGTLRRCSSRGFTRAAAATTAARRDPLARTRASPGPRRSSCRPVQSVGARDPETGAAIRDGIEPRRDRRRAARHARRRLAGRALLRRARDGVAFSRSTDGGLTWSTPVRVNSVPSVPAFVPAVNVRSDGTIGVTYYDLRNNTARPGDAARPILARALDRRRHLAREPRHRSVRPRARAELRGLVRRRLPGARLRSAANSCRSMRRRTMATQQPHRHLRFARGIGRCGGARLRPPCPRSGHRPRRRCELTPELARRTTASIARTMQRRVPARVAPWIDAGVLVEP